MRQIRFAALILIVAYCVFGQTYSISTFAGGALPINVQGISASLGAWGSGPQFITVDKTGGALFVSQSSILRLDAVTGLLTVIAGNGTPGFSGDNGPATNAQLYMPQGLAVDGRGNLYIADSGNNRIRKVANGVITTIVGNGTPGFNGDNGPAAVAQLNDPEGLAVDAAGNLFIADSRNQCIREISNGVITTAAGNANLGFGGDNGLATSAQLSYPLGLAIDVAGNLYIADAGNNRVRKVSNGVITTVAGNGKLGFSGDNGPATSAPLEPTDVAVDSFGSVYIVDAGNRRIRKLSNGLIVTVAGNGQAGFSGDNGPAAAAALSPSGIGVDPNSNLYIADASNSRIRRVSNGTITTVAGNGQTGSFGGDGGLGPSAQLNYPLGVAMDAGGNLYIADSSNNRVRKVSNGIITTVAGGGASSADNIPATNALLSNPRGVAVDSSGSLYITTGNRVRKVSYGTITTVAGNGSGGDNGPAINAELNNPQAVAADTLGNLYIAEDSRIRKVSGGMITTVAGIGTRGFGGDNGPATSAQLYLPGGLAVDSAGNLFIADSDNSRVRKVSSGIITTVVGNGTEGFGGDGGLATSASINPPEGITIDSNGVLYIPDGNCTIRRVSNGVITTIAGNGMPGSGGDNGPANNAQLSQPFGVTLDTVGNVYVADAGNNRIRLLTRTQCAYTISSTSLQSPWSGGNLTVSIQTTTPCTWTVSGLPTWITYTGGSQGGSSTITLVVGVNVGATRVANISIAGESVQITQLSTPSISSGGIVNAASSAVGGPVAAGSIATVYGDFRVSSLSIASGAPLPTELDGISLQVAGGLRAPLFAVSSGQVNFQVPWLVAGQSRVSFAAALNGQAGPTQSMTIASFAPGIFSMNGQGTGQGAIVDTSYRLVDSANPAVGGSTVIQIYCTGLGPVSNQPSSGSSALSNPLSSTTTTPSVTVGGLPAQVLFSGLAPGSVGEYQVNALVPVGPPSGGNVPVVIFIGGAASNTVTIAVQ